MVFLREPNGILNAFASLCRAPEQPNKRRLRQVPPDQSFIFSFVGVWHDRKVGAVHDAAGEILKDGIVDA